MSQDKQPLCGLAGYGRPGSLHLGKKQMYPLNRRLGEPHGRSGRFGEKKNLVLVPGIKTRIIQIIAESLYRLE
jgi:hypothetical protein